MARVRNYQSEKQWIFAKESKHREVGTKYSADFLALLEQRGVKGEQQIRDFVDPDYAKLSDPFLIPDMDLAVDRLCRAVELKEEIAIYGDYDVDGVTATALLSDFLESLGARVVRYIPSRFEEGYGLNKLAIRRLADKGIKLIITVDCGVTSIEEIKEAKELGVDVIVTDHHTLRLDDSGKVVLPDAVAVINPKRLGSDSPLYELAGVAVAFYLARATQTRFLDIYPRGQEKWLLDLVALGTICDIVPLLGENRILSNYGLKVLRKSRRIGLLALMEVSEVKPELVDSYRVGFLLGPRLNASGRLEHAKLSLDLLLSIDKDKALKAAARLNQVNLERQELTERIVAEARELIEHEGKSKKIYLLKSTDWPSGVVGIVASRLVDEYHRPMLIAEETAQGIKGSARSVTGFNIVEAISSIGAHFDRYGGHAYAAGFSFSKDKFVLIEDSLLHIADKQIDIEKLKPGVDIDLEISAKNITADFIDEVSLLEPFGRGNRKPVFAISGSRVADYRLVGSPPVHLKLTLEQGASQISGIAFGYGETAIFNQEQLYDFAVTLETNVWNNKKTPEFRVIDIRESRESVIGPK